MNKEEQIKLFQEGMKQDEILDKMQHDLRLKETLIRDRKANLQLELANESDKQLKLSKEANYGQMTTEQIAAIQRDSEEYIEAAKDGMMFINPAFEGAVPYFKKNLLLIGGKTGEGKSTTVANLVFSTIRQSNKSGKRRRVLVLTNEEKPEDIFNRITCLIKGWHYVNHDQFSDEQKSTFSQMMIHLSQFITIVHDDYNGARGVTTTLEGIRGIFDNLIEKNEYYDVVLLDYYQNINRSTKQPFMQVWQVQEQLAYDLDRYKNIYPCPIVVLAQVKPNDKDESIPFENRLKGRKLILDKSTIALEMLVERENLKTRWIIHKSRYGANMVGSHIDTGYDRGRFVEYNLEFIKKVNKYKEEKMQAEIDAVNRNAGTLKDIFRKEEENAEDKGNRG